MLISAIHGMAGENSIIAAWKKSIASLISPGQRILEIGCGMGDLLASLQPGHGVGVDFSPEMIQRARARHAALDALEWIEADAHDLLELSRAV